jgi:WhiB family transcriptional regulator, redox-sensing transcriptional regulator
LSYFTIGNASRTKSPLKEPYNMSLTWNRTVDWSNDNWRQASACRDLDPDLFFPYGDSAPEQTEEARKVCNRCDVKDACLEFALRANQEAGVWGGTSEDERRGIRRRWLAARRKARAAAN